MYDKQNYVKKFSEVTLDWGQIDKYKGIVQQDPNFKRELEIFPFCKVILLPVNPVLEEFLKGVPLLLDNN